MVNTRELQNSASRIINELSIYETNSKKEAKAVLTAIKWFSDIAIEDGLEVLANGEYSKDFNADTLNELQNVIVYPFLSDRITTYIDWFVAEIGGSPEVIKKLQHRSHESLMCTPKK